MNNELEDIPEIKTLLPSSLSPRQLREQLIIAGLIDQVETIVAAVPGIEGRIIRNWWDRATIFERSHVLIDQVAAQLNPPLTSAQIDDLFRAAALR